MNNIDLVIRNFCEDTYLLNMCDESQKRTKNELNSILNSKLPSNQQHQTDNMDTENLSAMDILYGSSCPSSKKSKKDLNEELDRFVYSTSLKKSRNF